MARREREVELSVERVLAGEAGGPPTVVRLSVRYPRGEEPPPPEELRAVVDALRADLNTAVGPATTARPDRSVDELIEAYHPRQMELVDLLRDEGEITGPEQERLHRHLARTMEGIEARAPSSAPAPRVTDLPIAASPLAGDRAPEVPRPVEELIDRYQIRSLRQAGAVRARRQISFEEYMALKRHFSMEGAEAPPA